MCFEWCFKRSSTEAGGCKPKSCPNKKAPCHLCKGHLQETQSFTSLADGRRWKIEKILHCRTPFIIYLIECQIHQVQYVGSSEKDFYKRWSDHKKDVRDVIKAKKGEIPAKRSPTGLANHFRVIHHDVEEDEDDDVLLPLTVTLIDCAEDKVDMKRREAYWIAKLGTLQTSTGLNRQQAINQRALHMMNQSFGKPINN